MKTGRPSTRRRADDGWSREGPCDLPKHTAAKAAVNSVRFRDYYWREQGKLEQNKLRTTPEKMAGGRGSLTGKRGGKAKEIHCIL